MDTVAYANVKLSLKLCLLLQYFKISNANWPFPTGARLCLKTRLSAIGKKMKLIFSALSLIFKVRVLELS